MTASMHNRDPLRLLRRRRNGLIAIGGASILVLGAWAVWPLPTVSAPTVSIEPTISGPSSETGVADPPFVIDREVFRNAALWNPLPPSPETKPARPAPLPPLVLVGIIERSEGRLAAALLNTTTSELHIVEAGDTIDPYAIQTVDESGLVLAQNGRATRLELRREPGP